VNDPKLRPGGKPLHPAVTAPPFVIPAKVTFVAYVAQFTPKTVETAEERQKLTFRIKAHINKEKPAESSDFPGAAAGCARWRNGEIGEDYNGAS